MRNERGLSWLGAIGILVAGFLALVAFSMFAVVGTPRSLKERAMDLNSLRGAVQWMADSGKIHATPDGRIDVYRMILEKRELDGRIVQVLYSEREGSGPSEREIRAGDYRNFPWERARVEDVRDKLVRWDGRVGVEPHDDARPLLWERKAHHDWILVAFTDGSAKALSPDEFKALVRRE